MEIKPDYNQLYNIIELWTYITINITNLYLYILGHVLLSKYNYVSHIKYIITQLLSNDYNLL